MIIVNLNNTASDDTLYTLQEELNCSVVLMSDLASGAEERRDVRNDRAGT